MKEPKADRFRRVAEARANKIIKMTRLLGNCSGTGVYEYTDAQVAYTSFRHCKPNWTEPKGGFTGRQSENTAFH